MYVELSCFLTILSRLTITSFSIANFVDVSLLGTSFASPGALRTPARRGFAAGRDAALAWQDGRHKKTPLAGASEVRG